MHVLYQEAIFEKVIDEADIANMLLVCIVLLICAVFSYMEVDAAMSVKMRLLMLFLCVGSFLGMICVIVRGCYLAGQETSTGRFRYYVTVDPGIDFNELYSKYTLAEQKGEIWILEEKEIE